MAPRILAGWSASLKALGGAFGELLQAELAVLGDEVSRSGKRLGGALLLLATALFVLFWAVGLAVYLAVEALHLWLPRWAAAAIVLGVALALMAVLAGVGWRRIKRLEPPTEMVRRRWSSHRDWWLDQFPAAGSAEPGAGGAASDRTDEG